MSARSILRVPGSVDQRRLPDHEVLACFRLHAVPGEDAVAALRLAVAHEDTEVSWRVRTILVEIGIAGNDATHAHIVKTMDELAQGGNKSYQNLAQEVRRWRSIRDLPPAEKIKRLNAFILRGGAVDPVFFGMFRGC